MTVLVVHVGKVRMGMAERFMPVPVGMPLAGHDRMIVIVLVMIVMNMLMVMIERVMGVPMPMLLAQMQPDADAHEEGRDDEQECDGLAQRHRNERTKEGCH